MKSRPNGNPDVYGRYNLFVHVTQVSPDMPLYMSVVMRVASLRLGEAFSTSLNSLFVIKLVSAPWSK